MFTRRVPGRVYEAPRPDKINPLKKKKKKNDWNRETGTGLWVQLLK